MSIYPGETREQAIARLTGAEIIARSHADAALALFAETRARWIEAQDRWYRAPEGDDSAEREAFDLLDVQLGLVADMSQQCQAALKQRVDELIDITR